MTTLGNYVLNAIGGAPDRLMLGFPDFTIPRHRGTYDEYLAALQAYAPERTAATGRPFFRPPAAAPGGSVLETHPYRDGRRDVISYPSSYHAYYAEQEAELIRFPANLTGYLNLWRHGDAPDRPLVLCLHGFMMGSPGRAEQTFKVSRMFELGLDVALYALPHHWRRRRGRQRLLNPDNVPLTLETMAQNIHDLHAAVGLLKNLGYSRIGLIGASMGGLTAALSATTDAAVDFMFMAVPAVTLERYLTPRRRYFSFAVDEPLRRATREALRTMTPTELQPRFDVSKLAVVYHRGDRLCEARYTRDWIEKWGIANAVEVTGGHWLYLDRGRRGRTWYEWLGKMGYI